MPAPMMAPLCIMGPSLPTNRPAGRNIGHKTGLQAETSVIHEYISIINKTIYAIKRFYQYELAKICVYSVVVMNTDNEDGLLL